MSLTWFLQLLSLLLVLSADTYGGQVPQCDINWFGSSCRYKCHCVNNQCDNKGECTQSSGCERGWFGPACQYVDLVSTNTTYSTPAWVYDFPDTLCNPGQETVTVSLQDTFYFTWLQLRANVAVNDQDFNLQLLTANSTPIECSKMYTSMVSDTILDIHCQPGTFFQELIITGRGVKSLCSVYISGGRNVALRQSTSQSSVLNNQSSSNAVDGDSNADLQHGSCTHTDINDHTPTWTLTFERPHEVNRYVIYNRDILKERLMGFILQVYQENGSVAFSYTDLTTISQSIYKVQSNTIQIPVTRVNIVATYNDMGETYLVFCEMEMFGDSVCPAGQYGRECENRCNCAGDKENCFVSTGGCPSGCAAGYQGEGCQNHCNSKFWGDNCAKPCSVDCKDELCNAINGTCISCDAGKSGEYCDQALSDVGPDESSPPIATIVGPVVGFVVLIALIVTGVLIWRRCRRGNNVPGKKTSHALQNYDELDGTQTVKSSFSERRIPHKVGTSQPGTPVIPKPNNQGNKNTLQHHHGSGSNNFVKTPNETSRSRSQRGPLTERKGNHYQEQLNRFPTINSAAATAASISEDQNNDRPNSDGNTYCIPAISTVMNQKDQQLECYESYDPDPYVNGIRDNPYEVIRDSTIDPYDIMNDM